MLYVKWAEVTAWFSQLKEKSTLVSVMTMAMEVSMKLAGVLNTSQTHNKLFRFVFKSFFTFHVATSLILAPTRESSGLWKLWNIHFPRIYIISLLVWISCTCVLTTDMALIVALSLCAKHIFKRNPGIITQSLTLSTITGVNLKVNTQTEC